MPLLQRDQLSPEIPEGAAVIVLKLDGSFSLFNTHKNLDPFNITEEQREQTKKVMALAVALKTPVVLDMLYESASEAHSAGTVLDLGGLQ